MLISAPGSGQIPMTLEPFYIVSVIGVSENPACFSYALEQVE
ncbi:MAG: hypothetical protein ACI8TX_003386, partial [Hyphomicrobiaceae bacterium]